MALAEHTPDDETWRKDDHLIAIAARGARCPCKCGGAASRFVRCRVGLCVIARCTSGKSMELFRADHEALCTVKL